MSLMDFTTNFQEKWRIWGEQNQALWDRILDITGDDPVLMWVVGSTIVILLAYWGYAAFFTFVDITNKPQWMLKYKIQPGQNEPVDKQKLWKAIKQVLFNQFVVTTITLYIANVIMSEMWTREFLRQLPTLKTFFTHLALMAVFEEPLFYYSHRMLHHRSIYKYVHKKHHEWTAPIAAMTFYCHPVEHIVSNIGPVALMAILLKSHITVVWTFAVLAIINSMSDHTGYYFPFPLSKQSVLFHDYHHAKFNYNFGVFGWLDKFHGTYKEKKDEGSQIKSRKPGNKLKSKKH